jgi:hypothetical protein
VTLTIGAADLDLSGVRAACIGLSPVGCEDAINLAPDGSAGLGGSLSNLSTLVADAAPNALIVVPG